MNARTDTAPKSLEKLQSGTEWQRIRDEFFVSGNARAVQSGLTAIIDRMAVEAFRSTLGAAFAQRVAILAVGGFGRRELFPYSDIDIMILLDSETQSPAIKETLSEFVRLLWDAGLRLSHSVRTVAECSEVHEQNVELNISLLDRRFLAGDEALYAKLDARLPVFLAKQGAKLSRHLCELTRSRHGKYQDTLFHLEPDVKESPGGLRDLHMIAWLARLRPEHNTEISALAQAAYFISSLRCFLHYHFGRDRNPRDFQRGAPYVGRVREKRQLLAGQLPGLAVAFVQRGFHRLAGARVPAQSGAARKRSRRCLPAARIHRTAWSSALGRDGAAPGGRP